MHRIPRILFPAVAALLLLASCHSVPKHARLIPKDALFVLGVHTGEMRKELAWSAITGSGLMEELRKAGRDNNFPEAIKDIEQSGIDFSSTLYVYTKPDTRFSQSMRMAAVLPVSDARKVTAYIRKYAPGGIIRTIKDRSELMIAGKVCISWNGDALVAMNPLVQKVVHEAPTAADSLDGGSAAWTEEIADSAATAAEMDILFNPAKDAAITSNARWEALEKGSHDITMWLGYDALMDAYSGKSGMGMMGVTMGNMLWKGSAMAAGLDFKKGRMDGELRYYTSDSMKDVAREMGRQSIDKDMLERLPAVNLNLAAGYHLAPQAFRTMLDKMGLAGMANLALMQKGLSVDDILGAFTGDMAIALNNFSVEKLMQPVDSVAQRESGFTPYPVTKPKADYVYVMKIGDKSKLTRLMDIAGLVQTAPNTYEVPNSAGGMTTIIGDRYLVVSNAAAAAQAFLSGGNAKLRDEVRQEITGHPTGMWVDVHSFLEAAGPVFGGGSEDSATYAVVRGMFTTLTAHGGEFKDASMQYNMSLSFTDKAESSLVQLLHMVQQIVSISNKKTVALR